MWLGLYGTGPRASLSTGHRLLSLGEIDHQQKIHVIYITDVCKIEFFRFQVYLLHSIEPEKVNHNKLEDNGHEIWPIMKQTKKHDSQDSFYVSLCISSSWQKQES